jgi:hypothetical protein
MNELVAVTADWFRETWAEAPDDDRDRLHEYIVDPNPLSENWYDEGEGD